MKKIDNRRASIAVLCFSMLFCSAAYAEELFYENCVDGQCQKRFLMGKEKISEGHYKAKVMLLDYRSKGSAEADEHYKIAEVVCDKAKPSVAWKNEKLHSIDKGIYATKVVKRGKRAVDEPVKKYDELTSLWKNVCHL